MRAQSWASSASVSLRLLPWVEVAGSWTSSARPGLCKRRLSLATLAGRARIGGEGVASPSVAGGGVEVRRGLDEVDAGCGGKRAKRAGTC